MHTKHGHVHTDIHNIELSLYFIVYVFHVQQRYKSEMEALQQQRDSQVESLIYDKEKVKEMEALRVDAVLEETTRCGRTLEELRALLEDQEKELEERDNRY